MILMFFFIHTAPALACAPVSRNLLASDREIQHAVVVDLAFGGSVAAAVLRFLDTG